MEAAEHAIEPQFLSRALANGTRLRIAQMNKMEHEGIIREIGTGAGFSWAAFLT